MLNKLTGAFSFASVTACIFCFIFFFGYSSNVLQASQMFSKKKGKCIKLQKIFVVWSKGCKIYGKSAAFIYCLEMKIIFFRCRAQINNDISKAHINQFLRIQNKCFFGIWRYIFDILYYLASIDAVCRRFAFLLEIDQLLWRIRMVYVSTRSFSLSLGWIRKDLSPNIHPKS